MILELGFERCYDFFQLIDPVFKELLLGLNVFGFLFLYQDYLLYFFAKQSLQTANPFFVRIFHFAYHALVHCNLLGCSFLICLLFFLQMLESLVEEAVEGLPLSGLAAALLDLAHAGDLLKDDVGR